MTSVNPHIADPNRSKTAVLHTTLAADHDTSKPPAKPLVITLQWFFTEYKVSALTNSTWYKPGHWMTPDVAQRLCDLPGWTVQTVDNDVISTLMGLGTQVAGKAISVTPVVGL